MTAIGVQGKGFAAALRGVLRAGRSAVRAVRAALGELGGLVLPVECAGCGGAGTALCGPCTAELATPAHRVGRAGRPVPGELPVWAGPAYTGPVREVVLAWKDRGRHDLSPVLAGALATAVSALLAGVGVAGLTRHAGPVVPPNGAWRGPPSGAPARSSPGAGGPDPRGAPVVLVPVPSRRSARRRRGADVVRRVALLAARRLRAGGLPVRVVPALRLGRPVADQAGLTRAGRARNVAGAMRLRAGARSAVAGRHCVVVDDVVTTGATAREALRVLAEAGAVPLGVAACTATPLHGGLSGAAHLH